MELLKPKNADSAIRDITTAEFEKEVVLASREVPVIVDFWAPWCGPCKQLMPVLEKLVTATKGAVRMVKVNIDQNPELAQALRVQSVPTVYAFYQGQPVDGFMGAQPEAQLRAFIERLTKIAAPAGDDDSAVEDAALALEQAQSFLDAGDLQSAQEIYELVLQHDPRNAGAVAGFLRCLTAARNFSDARKLLASMPAELAKDAEILSAKTALELAETLKPDGDAATLEKTLAANPADHASRYNLALHLYIAGRSEEAIDHLIEIMRRKRDWNEDAARLQLLKFFEALGPAHPQTVRGRRKLSSVLFS